MMNKYKKPKWEKEFERVIAFEFGDEPTEPMLNFIRIEFRKMSEEIQKMAKDFSDTVADPFIQQNVEDFCNKALYNRGI